MSYRLPFDGNYPVSCDWNCHKSKGGITAQYAGVDWAMPIGTPLYSLEAGTVTTGTDQYGALWANVKSIDGKRDWQYLHLSKFGHTGKVDPNMHVGFSGNVS